MLFQSVILMALALVTIPMLDVAHGCSCQTRSDICDYYDEADVVLHATVLSRTDEPSVSSELTSSSPSGTKYYLVDTITLYKGEPDVTYPEQISFSTSINEGVCGVNPNIGEEYLFGLHRIVDPLDPMDGGELGVTLCDLFLEWGAEDEEDLAMCACDPCGGACDDFEECMQYEKNGMWYCSHICAEGACAEGKACKTKARSWCRFSGYDGCPMKRVCN